MGVLSAFFALRHVNSERMDFLSQQVMEVCKTPVSNNLTTQGTHNETHFRLVRKL